MKMISRPVLGFVSALMGGVAVFAAVQLTLLGRETNPPARLNVQDTPINRETRGVTSYAPILKRAASSVVNIYSTRTVQLRRLPMFPFENPFGQSFGDDQDSMDRPGQNQNRGRNQRNGNTITRKEQGLGSGVIVSADGYILTANHVVEGADPNGVKVSLPSGGKEFTAKIIGTDPPTDVAVLKIDARDLPAITIADSGKLEVGDVCLAIGNPFGVGQTVTMGMVSALGRGNFPFGQITEYEDFIQTDAAINQGNSGGALIDAEGRLIGINTAIFSPSGGNAGIGFAVPVNLARTVMEHLVQYGKFTRGYLGVNIQSLTPDLAEEFKLPDRSGAIVSDVRPESPAEQAGLQSGDVIRELNGKPVVDSQQLRLTISQTAPGTKVALKIIRSEPGLKPVEKSFNATLAALRPEEAVNRSSRARPDEDKAAREDALDGVEVTDLNGRIRQQLGVPPAIRGALITSVEDGSASADAGLSRGDVILEINRQPVRSADDAVELSKKVKSARITLRVWRNGGSSFVTVDNAKGK